MLDTFKTFARSLAMASQELILGYYRQPDLDIFQKSNETPVTRADREAEMLMRNMISDRYPQHGIIGEEHGEYQPQADYLWTLDPIDGTITFTSGCPLFGTLICLQESGKPILGVLNLPALGQLFIGDGQITTCNEKVVRVRDRAGLSAATLLTTDLNNIDKYQSAQNFAALQKQCLRMRTWGDCYGYSLIASGGADIMCDPIMNSWDVLALIPIIEGAGGIITDWQGKPALSGSSSVAAAKSLHRQTIEILNA